MCRVVFKNNTERIITGEQLRFLLGIKDIKTKIFTFYYL